MIILLILSAGLLENVSLKKMPEAEQALLVMAKNLEKDVLEQINSGKMLNDEQRDSIIKAVQNVLTDYQVKRKAES